MLFDRFGRPLTNLRIMVTGRCNYRCFFCHMEGYREGVGELSLDELAVIAEAARRLDIRYFKLTGGEPLLRDDIVEVAALFSSVGYVTITTNGSLLYKYASRLADYVNHVNVSLHSLRRETYRRITGVDWLDRVLEGLRLARQHGIRVKINFVVLRGLNEDEIDELIDLAGELDAMLQIIELHPVGKATGDFARYHLPATRVVEKLLTRAKTVKLRRGMHNRPILLLDNGVEVEVVGPVGNYAFCSACTRVRISFDGKIIPCLNWRGEPPVDLRKLMAEHTSFEDKVRAVMEGLRAANSFRRPTYLWPLQGGAPSPINGRIMRLPLPKRDGSISLPGKSAPKYLETLKREWSPSKTE